MDGPTFGYHLECPSGLAGDMFLGACLDLGLPLEVLEEAIAGLGLEGVALEARSASRGGIRGVRFRVLFEGSPLEGPDPEEMAPAQREALPSGPAAAPPSSVVRPESACHDERERHGRSRHRDYASIRDLVSRSSLEAPVRERALELFARLAEVEGKIHGVPPEKVHFHEVGAIDSIVDIVGASVAIQHLGIESLTCGTLVVGAGSARTAHGVVPIPAPATAELILGLESEGGGEGELLTPTGALLLGALCTRSSPQPAMTTEAVGYGLGRFELSDRANACRLTRGALAHPEARGSRISGMVIQIETEVDDRSGEALGSTLERLLEEGCLDVFFTPAQMKKNRPGTLITVLCRPGEERRIGRALLLETGSLGCRYQRLERFEADRETSSVATRFGDVTMKLGSLEGELYVASPEYEDCRRLAAEHGVPVRQVMESAIAAARLPERGRFRS